MRIRTLARARPFLLCLILAGPAESQVPIENRLSSKDPTVAMVLTIIDALRLSGAIRRYAFRWFGIGVEPIVPRRLGH